MSSVHSAKKAKQSSENELSRFPGSATMSSNERIFEPAILTSWKEVACYLGKGVRTVQRWEKEDGLPIRRITGTSKIVVRRTELDDWLISQSAQSAGSQPKSPLLEQYHINIVASRELRKQHEELRHSLHAAMERLMNECRRMTAFCTPREQSLE